MTKKIALGLVALVAVAASVVGLSAFEAHVINVTAKIENALSVTTEKLNFGTVFPQEHLEQPLEITLSRSFVLEDRVDDVEYIIRQKPKCGVTENDGKTLVGPTWTGHVVPTVNDPATTEVDESKGGTAYTIDCGADKPKDLLVGTNQSAGLLPSLCEYISKDGGDEDGQSSENDGTTPSFHKPFEVVAGVVNWLDTKGKLTKVFQDTVDNWIIDLAVPCFGDHCAQDWADFVHGINPQANPDQYVQDINNEHKIFGCNLWIEVAGVSETQPE